MKDLKEDINNLQKDLSVAKKEAGQDSEAPSDIFSNNDGKMAALK